LKTQNKSKPVSLYLGKKQHEKKKRNYGLGIFTFLLSIAVTITAQAFGVDVMHGLTATSVLASFAAAPIFFMTTLTVEEQKEAEQAKLKAKWDADIDLKIKALQDKFKDDPTLKGIVESLFAEKTALMTTKADHKKAVDDIARIDAALLGMKAGAQVEQMSIKSQIEAWKTTNATAINAIKSGTKADLSPLNVKVNSPMTPSNTYNGSSYLPIPEFAPALRNFNYLYNYIKGAGLWHGNH